MSTATVTKKHQLKCELFKFIAIELKDPKLCELVQEALHAYEEPEIATAAKNFLQLQAYEREIGLTVGTEKYKPYVAKIDKKINGNTPLDYLSK